jgi:hypothetical protein
VVNENPHRYESDRQHNQLNTQSGEGSSEVEQNAPETVAHRFREATLPTDRFIDVEEGQKQSFDHTQRNLNAVSGNYGVYSGRGLVGFDIDDYQENVDTSALEALPSTFAVETPHGGEHWYYKGGQRVAAVIWSATGGATNLSLSWGEVYAGGKYLVGPGSRITECDKSHCRQCSLRGGTYSIEADRPIDQISAEQVLNVLSADPEFDDGGPQSSLGLYSEEQEDDQNDWLSVNQDLSSPSQEVLAHDDPSSRLWHSLLRYHNYNDVETGVKLTRLLDRTEELELNRWRASEQIMRWIESGRLKKSTAPNRIAPGWAELPGGDSRDESEQRGLDSFQ